ncbi:MAG: hypothetical protein V3T10_00225 [Candidatus Bathyarchaeia archaeon]
MTGPIKYCIIRNKRVARNANTNGRLSKKVTAAKKIVNTILTRRMDIVMDNFSRESLAN